MQTQARTKIPTDKIAPLSVSPRKARQMLDCGTTKLYALLKAGELESYRDGGARKITVRSIEGRMKRLLDQQQQEAPAA